MKYSEAIKIMGPEDVQGHFRIQFTEELEKGIYTDSFPDAENETPLTSLNEAWDAARRFASRAPWARNVTVVHADSNEPVDPHRIYNVFVRGAEA